MHHRTESEIVRLATYVCVLVLLHCARTTHTREGGGGGSGEMKMHAPCVSVYVCVYVLLVQCAMERQRAVGWDGAGGSSNYMW